MSAEQSTTLTERVIASIRQRIALRELVQGQRLPSLRDAARRHGVSKSTVVEAYERLRADGTILSRPGAGYYVSAPLPPLSLHRSESPADRAIDPLWISRQALDADTGIGMPGCGWLPADCMPVDSVRRALRSVSRADDTLLSHYGTPRGDPALRTTLSRHFLQQGVSVPPERIVLTDSATQAIDLVCRLLLEQGDTVLLDDPCYFNFHGLLKAQRLQVVSVPFTPTGPDPDYVESVLRTHRPRLYITNSGAHNPTGARASLDVNHQLLKLADQYDLTVIDDDTWTGFDDVAAPGLAALDAGQRVCRIGSFSKTISASLRCGYIAAPGDWIDPLLDLRVATTFGSNPIAAALTRHVLTDPAYHRHLRSLRERLAQQRARLAERLARLGIRPWLMPTSGLYLWCRLPGGIAAGDVARKALASGLVLAPGNAFSPARAHSDFMRFNVSQCEDDRWLPILEKALKAAG